MYYIKKSEWERLEKEHPDYCGKSITNPNIKTIFEGIIPENNGKGGTTLLFENQHFIIVNDDEFATRNDETMENPIGKLWEYACSGENEKLQEYYNNGGKVNRRYRACGKYHSLIAGAYRNGNIETVMMLIDNGETIQPEEQTEINLSNIYMENLMMVIDDVIGYFDYHNKNLTKAQEWKLNELKEIYRKIRNEK